MLKKMGFHDSQLKNYSSFEQYDEALQKGSRNGGASAIMAEINYIRVFFAKYCTKYIMTGPTYKTAGFGFAFPKGSPLVPDVSRAILQVTEEQMTNISRKWFGESDGCDQQNDPKVSSDRLTLDSFNGLFLIAGLSSTSAVLIFFVRFLYQNRETLKSQGSISQRLATMAKTFDVFKDDKSRNTSREAAPDESVDDIINNSPEVSVHHQAAVFSHDEGFSTTEPGAPVHETIELVETTVQT